MVFLKSMGKEDKGKKFLLVICLWNLIYVKIPQLRDGLFNGGINFLSLKKIFFKLYEN